MRSGSVSRQDMLLRNYFIRGAKQMKPLKEVIVTDTCLPQAETDNNCTLITAFTKSFILSITLSLASYVACGRP